MFKFEDAFVVCKENGTKVFRPIDVASMAKFEYGDIVKVTSEPMFYQRIKENVFMNRGELIIDDIHIIDDRLRHGVYVVIDTNRNTKSFSGCFFVADELSGLPAKLATLIQEVMPKVAFAAMDETVGTHGSAYAPKALRLLSKGIVEQ